MSETAAPVKIKSTDKWWVQVRGKAYGPYSRTQLGAFVQEGRVRPTTQISNHADSGWIEARRIMGLIAPAPTGEPANDAAEAANVFVHAEIFSGSWMAFMAALESMGTVCELGPGVWLVRTRFTAGVMRNTLCQTLELGDRFVVVDATRDRFAWFNLGPEVDVRISKVWNAPLRAQDKSA